MEKSKAGRKPGTPKTGGRKAGTPNKITGDMRTRIQDLLDDNWEKIQDDLQELDAEKRLAFLEKLLKYTLPTLSSVSSEIQLQSRLEGLNENQLNILITQILEADDQQEPAD